MEAHEAMERFEHAAHGGHGHDDGPHGLATQAAVVVSVLAAFLAVATFQGNESLNEGIQNQTKATEQSIQQSQFQALEANIAFYDAIITVIGTTSDQQQSAAASAAVKELEKQSKEKFPPLEQEAQKSVNEAHAETRKANDKHKTFELSEVGLQLGIVLAGISIIARRRWLLGISATAGAAGIVILVVGMLM